MSCARAPAEDVHMHAPVLLSDLRAFGRRGVVQRPVAGLEVIDAAAIELRQHVDHRPADGADQEAPVCKFDGRELALLPDRARQIDDEMAAILAVEKYGFGSTTLPPGPLFSTLVMGRTGTWHPPRKRARF